LSGGCGCFPQDLLRMAILAFIIVALYVSVTLAQYERNEARYQRELKAFSEAYKPGMKREDLENYFRSRNIHFAQMW
jgi:type II secretory pathway component PulL